MLGHVGFEFLPRGAMTAWIIDLFNLFLNTNGALRQRAASYINTSWVTSLLVSFHEISGQ